MDSKKTQDLKEKDCQYQRIIIIITRIFIQDNLSVLMKRTVIKRVLSNTILQQLIEKMSPEQLGANDLAKIKDALSWLTTLPLKSENFNLNKREFYDAFSLWHRWKLKYLPSTCPCGKRFDVDHAVSCMKGGFVRRSCETTCETCSHPYSWTYAMILRWSHTLRP